MENLTLEQIKNHQDFNSSLELPEIQLYTLWNGAPFVTYYAFKDGKLLFSGEDFKPGAMLSPDSLECIVTLLSFLCVQPGDTDADYFKNYNSEQMKWANSFDAERLKGLCGDFEDGGGEYYAPAHEQFYSKFNEF